MTASGSFLPCQNSPATGPNELETILDFTSPPCGITGPCIDPIFGPTAPTGYYWTGTTTTFDPTMARFVYFGDGASTYYGAKYGRTQARAVRSASVNYTLSGSADGTKTIHVDDDLDVRVNGTLIYTDGTGGSGDRPPISFTAVPAQQMEIVVRDTFGNCSSLSGTPGTIPQLITDLSNGLYYPLYLTDDQGHSTQVDPGFNLGCGRPGTDLGIVHDNVFALPF